MKSHRHLCYWLLPAVAALLCFALTGAAGEAAHGSLQVPAPAAEFAVSESGRHLVLDRRPFFWLADTAWLLAQVPSREELEVYLKTRRAQGFTVIQFTAVMGEERVWGTARTNRFGDKPFLNGNPGTPAVTPGNDFGNAEQWDYWDQLDYVIDRINEHHMRSAIVAYFVGSGGDGYKYLKRENALSYGRFLGERYRSKHQIIWILGGDNTPDTPEKKEVWNLVARGITEGEAGREDYTQTLMTYHINSGASSSEFWHNAPWLDFNMAQTWSEYKDIYGRVSSDYRKTPAKPCGLGEGAYENGPQYPTKPINDLVIRKQAYWSYFAGGYHTYGNGDVWHFDSLRAESTQPWKEALNSPGARQMAVLRKFFDRIVWWWFVPDQELFVNAGDRGSNCAMKSAKEAVFYITSTNEVRVALGNSGAELKGVWMNPCTGEDRPAGKFVAGKEAGLMLPQGWRDGLLIVK